MKRITASGRLGSTSIGRLRTDTWEGPKDRTGYFNDNSRFPDADAADSQTDMQVSHHLQTRQSRIVLVDSFGTLVRISPVPLTDDCARPHSSAHSSITQTFSGHLLSSGGKGGERRPVDPNPKNRHTEKVKVSELWSPRRAGSRPAKETPTMPRKGHSNEAIITGSVPSSGGN